jgi:hypothetical protein
MSQFESGHSIGKSTRFQPGQSGNPGGRPKGLATIARKVLSEAAAQGDITKGEALMRKLYDLALDGNVHAIKLLLDREWPAPTRSDASREGLPMVVIRDYTGRGQEKREERVVESVDAEPTESLPERTLSTWAVRRPDDDERDPAAVL